MRRADGTWAQGTSGNPEGHSYAEMDKIYRVRRAAQARSLKSIRTLEKWMDGEDGKVAVAAAVAMLKVAGAFEDKAAIDRKVQERLQEMLEAAQKEVPKLAAVG